MNVTIAIGATLFLGAFYSWTNRINGTFFFGRSASPEAKSSPQARAITRHYLTAVIATTAAAIFLSWFGARLGRNFAAIGPLFEVLAFWAIFARANRQARDLETTHGQPAAQESIVQVPLLETPKYTVPDLPTALLPAILGVIAFLAALCLAAKAATGHATNLSAGWTAWAASIDAHLATLLGMSIGMLAAATGLLLLFRSSARLRTNMAQYTVRASVAMEWIGLALLLVVLACNYLGVSPAQHTVKAVIAFGFAAALATVLWNQARAKRFVPPPVELGADDRWRWGLFYVDRNDPALFVQSRCGAGYTLNYGRMLAWPISFALVAYVIAMMFMPRLH